MRGVSTAELWFVDRGGGMAAQGKPNSSSGCSLGCIVMEQPACALAGLGAWGLNVRHFCGMRAMSHRGLSQCWTPISLSRVSLWQGWSVRRQDAQGTQPVLGAYLTPQSQPLVREVCVLPRYAVDRASDVHASHHITHAHRVRLHQGHPGRHARQVVVRAPLQVHELCAARAAVDAQRERGCPPAPGRRAGRLLGCVLNSCFGVTPRVRPELLFWGDSSGAS